MERIIIQGKNITLKEITRDELSILINWRNSPDFKNFCISNKQDCTIELLNQEMERSYSNDKYAHFLAWDRFGQPVGTNWIYRYNSNYGIGYTTTFVAKEYRTSQYYGVEMFILTCRYMFQYLGCRKIYSEVHANNLQSVQIFQKLKIPLEGKLERHVRVSNDEYVDLLIFALYKEQFEKSELLKRFL